MSELDARIPAAWAASATLHEPGPPASTDELESAERSLGRRLPEAVLQLYRLHDGGAWFRGDLQLLPALRGAELSVARASATYRAWGWPVPEEVVVFGSDGGGDPVGLWLPDEAARPVVVHIGAVFEPGCMAVVGEDVSAFLLAWTAFRLLLEDPDVRTAGIAALDLPARLRWVDPDDADLGQLVQWASPTMPAELCDPYEARLTPADVRRIAAAT